MFFSFQSCFFTLLITNYFSILHGSEVKPIKGETCSFSGPSEFDDGEENPCFKDGLFSAFFDIRLSRRDGVAVGHVETIQLEEEGNVQLTTRSLKPPIFEISDLLSDEECDHVVELANKNGLAGSNPAQGPPVVTREGVNETLTQEQMKMTCKRITRYDNDKNGNVTMVEFASYVYHMTKMLVRMSDLWTVYETLLPEDARVFTYENCTKVNRTRFVEFIYQLWNINRLPYYNARYSEQAWVELSDEDPVLKRMKSRIAEITHMPASLIDHSEDLQVVKYLRGGHYHAHYDSTVAGDSKEKRCCGKFEDKEKKTCLMCRYITILLFLNNVTEGGETAFPVADHEDLFKGKNFSSNLSRSCEKASLVVKPIKGRALFWYNNELDEESGKMGEVDMLSLHGGCDVIKGEKWIANLWINAPRADQTV